MITVAGAAPVVLDTLTDVFGDAGVVLPDRRLICAGSAREQAWDRDCVIVTVPTLAFPASLTGESRGNTFPAATLTVQIVRQVPEMDPESRLVPPVAAVTTAGLAMAQDMVLLARALTTLATGTWRATGVTASSITQLGPSGRYAAVEGSLTIPVPL